MDGQSSVSHFDNIEVAVKLATFAFKKQRLLPVYGVSLELPSGSDQKEIGSGHIFQIEPYLGLGIKRERSLPLALPNLQPSKSAAQPNVGCLVP